MSERYALIIGVDASHDLPPTLGARADALDLARALLDKGVDPASIRVLLSCGTVPGALPDGVTVGSADARSILAGLDWLAASLRSDDDTAIVHYSGPACTIDGESALALHTGEAPERVVTVARVLAPLAARPIRSVLFSLDADFGEAHGATDATRDPVLLPTSGQPRELEIDGAPRGLMSWALARAIRAMPENPSLTLGDLRHVVQRAMAAHSPRSTVHLLPQDKHELPLGAFAEPGPAHVPWRGIAAAWQFSGETGNMLAPVNGNFIVGATPDRERWVWNTQPWPTSGFQVQVVDLNPQPVQTPYTYSNNGFSGPVSSTPPQIGQGDRIFQVDAPGANGAQVWLIVRNVQQPTAMEWYTTSTNQFIPVSVNDVLDFAHKTSLPQDWSSHTWYRARETP